MKLYRIFICLIAVAFLLNLHAEPLNVLVGDLTFIRPESWQLAPPPPPANARFMIRAEDNKGVVEVRFYAPGKTPLEARAKWKTFIAPDDADSFRLEEKTIGKRTITYVTFQGKIKLPNEPAISNAAFVGVIIPYEDKFMHIRMCGPQGLVLRATATFKKMLEDAVRERESELGN